MRAGEQIASNRVLAVDKMAGIIDHAGSMAYIVRDLVPKYKTYAKITNAVSFVSSVTARTCNVTLVKEGRAHSVFIKRNEEEASAN